MAQPHDFLAGGGRVGALMRAHDWATSPLDRPETWPQSLRTVVALLPRLLWHLDEPVADTAFVTTYLVSEFARRDVTVILSGVGGDELFGGYRRYLGGRYRAQLDRVPGPLRRAAIALAGRLPADRHSPLLNTLRLARGFLESASLPAARRAVDG